MDKLTANRYYLQARQQTMANQTTSEFTAKQKLLLAGIAVFCIVFSVIVFAPAAWLSSYLQDKTNGRIVLADAEGSVWNGSVWIAVATDQASEIAPVVPGRFEWHLSPIILLGQIELLLENTEALGQPLYITGNVGHLQISPNSLTIPAARLASLGAPLNTIKPEGQVTLSWDVLGLTFDGNAVDIDGTMQLNLEDISSALSQVKPLGSYLMDFNWHGHQADIELKTVHGPMLLDGKGTITHGHLRFSGTAQAEPDQEDNLISLLNLLGQRRYSPSAGKNVIALEFK